VAWDARRPIPWRRLLREALIFLVIGGIALTVLVKKKSWGTYTGLLLGMVFYVLFVAILSKFGYERQTLRDARERRRAQMAATKPAASRAAAASTGGPSARARPAPTRRTSSGPSNRPSSKKRRR
jgi:hypothetical protein